MIIRTEAMNLCLDNFRKDTKMVLATNFPYRLNLVFNTEFGTRFQVEKYKTLSNQNDPDTSMIFEDLSEAIDHFNSLIAKLLKEM